MVEPPPTVTQQSACSSRASRAGSLDELRRRVHDRFVEDAGNRKARRQRLHHLRAARRTDKEHALGRKPVDLGGEPADASGTEDHASRERDVSEFHKLRF